MLDSSQEGFAIFYDICFFRKCTATTHTCKSSSLFISLIFFYRSWQIWISSLAYEKLFERKHHLFFFPPPELSCLLPARFTGLRQYIYSYLRIFIDKYLLICEGMCNPSQLISERAHRGSRVFSLNFMCFTPTYFPNGWIKSEIRHRLGMSD